MRDNNQNLRAGFRAVLAAGVLASVAANIAVAQPNPTGWAVAMIAPITLFATIEMLARFPFDRSSKLSWLRLATTGLLGFIGAWVSYWHMVTLAERAGEEYVSAHILPIAVDGMMLVATVSLIEINMRIVKTAQEAEKARVAALSIPERIALLLADTPKMTTKALAAELGVSYPTANKYRKALATAPAV